MLNEEESKRLLADRFDLFTRHLIAAVLNISDPTGKQPPRREILPGILLRCRNRSFYLSAGHMLEGIEEGIRTGNMKVDNAVFVDSFGPKAPHPRPVPFGFADLPRYYVNNSQLGLDIGLIELTPFAYHFLPLFEVNKIMPIEEDHWTGQDLRAFAEFYVLGFPKNLHEGFFAYDKPAVMRPALIPLEWIQDPSEEVTKGRKALFCGRFSEKLEVSIEGASGGPIFGVKTKPELQYQVVAMQFAQRAHDRIAIGCVMPFIGLLLTKWIEKNEESA